MMALPEKSRKLGVGTNQSSTSMNLKRKVLINALTHNVLLKVIVL